MMTAGLAIPVLRCVNCGWRDSSSADVADVGRLLDGAEPDELRETTRHLALLVVSLASLIEERHDEFTFDGWIAHQQEWLTLEGSRRPVHRQRRRIMKTESRRPWHPTQAEIRFVSGDALNRQWSYVLRRAATAQFPRQYAAELRSAAYLAGHLVTGERLGLDEARARAQLMKAAKRAGVRPAAAQSVISDGLQARAHAFDELERGGVDGDRPGAFSAVASASTTYDHENRFHVDPLALVPLPRAVLVHRGHDLDRPPVGIAVPAIRGGTVHIDAVFASQRFDSEAGPAWTLVRTKRIRGVSIYAASNEFHRGVDGRLVSGTLISVDLVRTPVDGKASIGEIIPAASMTPGQRQTQRLLDRYLADRRNPFGRALMIDAVQRGAEALDVLGPIVAPLVAEQARGLTSVGR